MPVTRLGTGLALLLLALGACSSGDSKDATPPPPATETVDSTALDLRGTWKVVVPGVPREGIAADATAVFREPETRGGFSVSDGCNSTSGQYASRRSGDLWLLLESITRVGCPEGTPPVLALVPNVKAAEQGPDATVLLIDAQGDTVLELAPAVSNSST